jgi:hypothetical protein
MYASIEGDSPRARWDEAILGTIYSLACVAQNCFR